MDILDAVAVVMPCNACSGEYEVTLRQALLSHKMLHDGCPVSDERECPPLYWSHILDEQLARELQSIWSRLEDKARQEAANSRCYASESEMRYSQISSPTGF